MVLDFQAGRKTIDGAREIKTQFNWDSISWILAQNPDTINPIKSRFNSPWWKRPEEPYLLQHLNLQLIVFKSSFYCLPWRTDTSRNRTKKASNVPSEILLKIAFCQFCEPFPVVLPPVPILKTVFCQFCQPFPVVLPPVLKTALHTKTPWQWRTDTPRNRTKKLSNVPSETLLKIVFCQYSATPKHHGSEGRTRHEIAPKKCLTSLLKSY